MSNIPNQRRASSNPFIIDKDELEVPDRKQHLQDATNSFGSNIEKYDESFKKRIVRLGLGALGLLIIPAVLIIYFAFIYNR